jgi:hypothetical protein
MVCRFRKYYRCVILHALTINVRELAEAWRVWDKSTTDTMMARFLSVSLKLHHYSPPVGRNPTLSCPWIEKDIASALLPETDRLFEK